MDYLIKLNKHLTMEFQGRIRAKENDGCLILEGESDNWEDIVKAGSIAVKFRKKDTRRFVRDLQKEGNRLGGLVNTIHYSGEQKPIRLPALCDKTLDGQRPDVLIIGGGISGCTIARELARYNLEILLVEKEHDLALHASSRNDGIVHPGADLRPGSWKYYYNLWGNSLYDKLCEELGVNFERTSQYVCFTKLWIKPILYLSLFFLWKRIKIPTKITGKKELRLMIPGINKNIVVALDFPSTGVVCPYNLTIACGENAVENGVKISLNTSVLNMETKEGSITAVHTNRGILHPKIVINAAGVFSDDIAAMAGDRFFSIHPRRGTNIILDKKFTKSIALISLSKKTDPSAKTHTKGGGIIRTVHWNILVGPDAVETPLREDFAVQKESVETTIQRFSASSAKIDMSQIITYFTGVRAPSFEEDFIVCKGRRCANLVHAAAIQSPGLTAAPAIAIDVARMTAEVLEASGQKVLPNKNFNPVRKRIPHIAVMSDEERAEMIKQNPDYGIILCRCEEVSKGEIIDALRRPVPCDTIDGVKRRVRSGMGRCQGGFCSPLILQIIAHEKNIPFEQVTKNGPGSKVLYKPTK